ncbi:hypothetical protein WDW89_24055 [Deltaproteobacteria bacterium TL4]
MVRTVDNIKESSRSTHGKFRGINDQDIEKLVVEIAKTWEFKKLIASLIPEMLNIWAGNSRLKKWMTLPVERSIKSTFIGIHESSQSLPSSSILEDPGHLENLGDQFITLVNHVIGMSVQVTQTIETLPPEKKEEFLGNIVSQLNLGQVGEGMASFGRMLNEVHDRKETFISDHLKASVAEGMERFDFGILQEFVKKSQADFIEFTKIVNTELWKSPEKMTDLLGLIPASLNALMGPLHEILDRFKHLSEDELTELVLLQLEKIDGVTAGKFLNVLGHVIRKLEKGTAYLRDPELPIYENEVVGKLEEIAGSLDTDLILKSRLILEEVRKSLRNWLMS